MILYHTLQANNDVLAVHQSLGSARDFAANWADLSGANRKADRIVSADRDSDCIYKGKAKFKVSKIIEVFSL